MKYFVSGILILALVVWFCAAGLHFENRHLGEVLTLLEQASEVEDGNSLPLARRAYALWQEDAARFALLLTLEDVGELDRAFETTLRALDRGDESGPELLSDLRSLVEALLRRDQLTWENVL